MNQEQLNKGILEARKKLRDELDKVQKIILATCKTADEYLESMMIQ